MATPVRSASQRFAHSACSADWPELWATPLSAAATSSGQRLQAPATRNIAAAPKARQGTMMNQIPLWSISRPEKGLLTNTATEETVKNSPTPAMPRSSESIDKKEVVMPLDMENRLPISANSTSSAANRSPGRTLRRWAARGVSSKRSASSPAAAQPTSAAATRNITL